MVGGKGGVGKTTLAHVLARGFARSKVRTLYVSFEPESSSSFPEALPHLTILHCDILAIFGEYARSKIRISKLADLFLRNHLIQYLIKAAPGVPELLKLGKVWSESKLYDRVIVDLPSTGYSLALFQSLHNFLKLFHGGPIQRETQMLLDFYSSPSKVGLMIVALPEEMPLQEALEHAEQLEKVLPGNPPAFVVNRCMPGRANQPSALADLETAPLLVSTLEEYIALRRLSETEQIQKSLEKKTLPHEILPWALEPIEENLMHELIKRGWFVPAR